MKKAISFLSVACLFLCCLLTSCSTTPPTVSEEHMSQANDLLRQARDYARASDFENALQLAPVLAAEVKKGVETSPASAIKTDPAPDLESLLAAWESGSYAAWTTALEAGDAKATRQSLVVMKQQCASCHAAIGRPMIHVTGVR